MQIWSTWWGARWWWRGWWPKVYALLIVLYWLDYSLDFYLVLNISYLLISKLTLNMVLLNWQEWRIFLLLLLSESTSYPCHVLYPSPRKMIHLVSLIFLLEDMFWLFILERQHSTRQLLSVRHGRWLFHPPVLIDYDQNIVLVICLWNFILWSICHPILNIFGNSDLVLTVTFYYAYYRVCSINELFIFPEKDRRVSNMLLRFQSWLAFYGNDCSIHVILHLHLSFWGLVVL